MRQVLLGVVQLLDVAADVLRAEARQGFKQEFVVYKLMSDSNL